MLADFQLLQKLATAPPVPCSFGGLKPGPGRVVAATSRDVGACWHNAGKGSRRLMKTRIYALNVGEDSISATVVLPFVAAALFAEGYSILIGTVADLTRVAVKQNKQLLTGTGTTVPKVPRTRHRTIA